MKMARAALRAGAAGDAGLLARPFVVMYKA